MVDIRVDMSLDYPVSIESILSLSFNQDSFKVVFQFILEALRRHEGNFKALKDLPSKVDLELINKSLKDAHGKISDLQNSSENHEQLLKAHSENIQKNKQHMEKTDKVLENIQKLLDTQERSLESAKAEINSLLHTSDTHSKTLSSHSEEINLLKKLLSQVGNDSGPAFPIEALDMLEKRITEVDTRHSTTESAISERLSQLESLLKSLKENTKNNTEDISQLKQMIAAFEDRLKSKADSADLDKLKNFRPTPGGQAGNMSHYDSALESLQAEIDILKKKVAEIPVLVRTLDGHSKRISDLEDRIKSKMDSSEVLSLINGLKPVDSHSSAPGKDPNIGYILKKLMEHDEKIEAILKLLQKPQSSDSDLWNLYNELRLLLDSKASLADLKSLEERLQEKVIAVCEAMGNKFADRADTKKALKYLEGLIREYLDFSSKKPMGEDAMFAKKPLGGWSCASCETNLEKLKGMAAAYYSWNKMPYRDPNDRIARAGPGFSKMLATIQPEALASRVRTANTKIGSQIEEEFPPPDPRSAPATKKAIRPMSAYHH